MRVKSLFAAKTGTGPAAFYLLLCWPGVALATDWSQYRGPTSDGFSPDPIATSWPAGGPSVVWMNASLTNGFSSFAVSQGRAFTLISKDNGSGSLLEYCVAVDAATGTNIWASPIGAAPWNPASLGDGGDGVAPYNLGDGPRSTPAVVGSNVIVLSGHLVLASFSMADGSTNWLKDLEALYGAREVLSGWNNAASPRLDDGLIFVNLNTPTNNNLCAFSTTDGSRVWGNFNETLTHTTPIVATILGTRQVIFATVTGLVGLDRNTGSNLWKFTYPWYPIDTSMGASPVVYSNIVYCTAGYGRGSAAVSINFTNGIWYATNQLWAQTFPSTTYQSIWMTPVVYQGYIFGQFGNKNYLTCPLNCIELASGNLMWSTNNFGQGGTIRVNGYLLCLTEDGQLVLAKADPAGYTELARFQAFHFSFANPGKCWNSPAYSNGRVYARSTAGGICVDVSVPPALKLMPPQFLSSTQLELQVGTADGTPLDPSRLLRIEVHATNNLAGSPLNWPKLTNALSLGTNGLAGLTNAIGPGQSRQFYGTVESP